MTAPQLKPSPVDEASLKQALQRVEDRLRRQDEKRKKDEHHNRTLKLAREFAAQGVRQRQRNWERQNRNKNIEQPSDPDRSSEKQAPESKQIDTRQTLKKVIPLQDTPAKPLPGKKNKGAAAPKAAVSPEAIHSALGKAAGGGLMRLMPIVAWLILGAGVIGAILSWTTISDVQANSFQINAAKFQSLPMGLLLGFAYLATGVLGFAFFWVSSLIGNQLKEIRRLLFLYPMTGERSKQ